MGTGVGIERKLIKTCDIGQSLLKIIVEFKGALCTLLILQRMNLSESRHAGQFLIDLRIIFHGA